MQTDTNLSDSVLKLELLENKLNSIVTDAEDSNIANTSISKIKTCDAKALLEAFKNEQPKKNGNASTMKETAVFQDLQVGEDANVKRNKLQSSLTIIPGKNFGGKYSKIVLLADETFQGLQEHWPANDATVPDWIYSHRLKLSEIKPILEEYCLNHLPRGGKLFVIVMVRLEEKLAYIPSSACKNLWKRHFVPMKEVTTVDVTNPHEQFAAVLDSIKGLPCAEIDLVFTPVVPSNLCKIQEKLIYTHKKLTKHCVNSPKLTASAYNSCYDYMRDCLKLNEKLGDLCLTDGFSQFSKWKIFSWESQVFHGGHHFDPDSIPHQRNGRYMLEEILVDTAAQLCKFINLADAPCNGFRPLPMQCVQKIDRHGQKRSGSTSKFSEIVFLLDPKIAEFAKYWPSNFPVKTSFEVTAYKLCPTEVKELIQHKYQGDEILFIHCPSVKSLLQIKQLDECKEHLKLKYPACQNGLDSSLYCRKFLSQLKLLRSLLQEDFPHSSVCFTTLHCVDFAKFIPDLIVKHENATAHCCSDFFKHFISQHNDCFRQAVTAINKGIISLNTESVPISFDVCAFVNTGKEDQLFNGLHLNKSALQIFSKNLQLSLRKCNVLSFKTAHMAMQSTTISCPQSSRSRSPRLNKNVATLRKESLRTKKCYCEKPKTSQRSIDILQIRECPSGQRRYQSPHLLMKLNQSSSNLMRRLGERPIQTTEIPSGSLNLQGPSPIQICSPPMFNCLSECNQTPQIMDQLLVSNTPSSPTRRLFHPMRTRLPPRKTCRLPMRTRSPTMRSCSPAMRSCSPAMRSCSPAMRSHSPAMRSHSPAMRSRSPAMRSRSPAMRSHSPAMRSHSPAMRSRSPAMRSRSPAMRSRSPGMRSRSPGMRSRSPAMRSHSPAMRPRSPAMRSHSSMRSRSSAMRSCSPAMRSCSQAMRSHSPVMRSRSPALRSCLPSSMRTCSPPLWSKSPSTPCQSSSDCWSPPERRFSFHLDNRANSARRNSASNRKQMPKTKQKTHKLESNEEPIATHYSFLREMSTDNNPSTRSALKMLSKIHRKECATYRSQPYFHPDYRREKALFFERTNSSLDKTFQPSFEYLTKQFEDYWITRMEEIFLANWEEKKNNYSAMIARDNSHTTLFTENHHLVEREKLSNSEELPGINSGSLLKSTDNTSDDAYTNTELLRKIDAVLKKSEIVLNKGTTNIDLVKAGHEKVSHTQLKFNDQNNASKVSLTNLRFNVQSNASTQCAQERFVPKINVAMGHPSPVSVESNKEHVDPKRLNSVTALPTDDTFDVIESLKILSQMPDQFGTLLLPLSMILNTAIAAQMNNCNVLQIFADQERDILELCIQKLTELRASNLTFVQKVIIDEAFNRLELLLLRIHESQDPMFGIEVKELARELRNLDPSTAIARIKQIIVNKGFSSVKDGQILKIYMNLKSQYYS